MRVLDWFYDWPFESTWDIYQGFDDDWTCNRLAHRLRNPGRDLRRRSLPTSMRDAG
jgi:hypothetical protein